MRSPPFADGGHGVGTAVPYLPAVAADEAAHVNLWPQIVTFMRGLRGG